MTDKKEPLQAVIEVATSITSAKNVLQSQIYGGLTNSTAMGNLAYAIADIPAAVDALREDGAEFFNMQYQEPMGDLWLAHNMLAANAVTMNPCVWGEVMGIVARAHMSFRRFHRKIGYREITDEDLEKATRRGVGGGR